MLRVDHVVRRPLADKRLAEACERVFAGCTIVEAEVKAKALSWVPEPMRFASDDTPPWSVEDEVHAAADEILMAISDETVVIDAGAEDSGAGEDQGETPRPSSDPTSITVTSFSGSSPIMCSRVRASSSSRLAGGRHEVR